MPRTAPSADPARVYALIPIVVFISIDAGTASSSAFQRKLKIVHDHAGIVVHVRLESAFTMRWKPCSPCAGICTWAQHFNDGAFLRRVGGRHARI
jgi:hypothetical protein